MAHKADLRRKLNTFDVTSLVVGSIIGADVYVATAITARLVGPSSLLIWILAGVVAMVIALSFAYCVMLLPKVGGPYAYAKEAASPFAGFMVGWGMLLAEWFSLAVFPVAFAQYFAALVPGIGDLGEAALKALFIAIVMITNLVGIKIAGRVNDSLTIAKLSPLIIIILGGLGLVLLQPSFVSSNLSPFLTGGLAAYGQAFVLIFWAYAGFELSTLPANEVDRPETTIPRAIMIGMLIVISFYLLTNFAVLGSVSQSSLISSNSPLITAAGSIFSTPILLSNIVVAIVGVGALLSITGADESGTLGTSRLAYAMSIDGLLPKAFSETHPRFSTPYLGLIILCSTAFLASLIGGLSGLINSSVFLLSFAYLATCLSTLKLERMNPEKSKRLRGKIIVPALGAVFSALLIVLVNPFQIAISLLLLGVGVPIYIFFSPKQEIKHLREAYFSREAVIHRSFHQTRRFLAYPVTVLRLRYHRLKGISRAFEHPNHGEIILDEEERQAKRST